MGHESRIVEAFTTNGIERVLFIDDVYDPPPLDETWAGELLDLIESEHGRAAATERGLDQQALADAAAAIGANNYGHASVSRVVAAIYSAYVVSREDRFDPGGHFRSVKGAGLDALEPVVALVRKCGDKLSVQLAGLQNGEAAFQAANPDILFLDYFLSPDVPVTGKVSKGVQTAARAESIALLKRILDAGGNPAVVLLSSHDKSKDVVAYRRSAGPEKTLAVRFRFLKKQWVKVGRRNTLTISHDAADALLDTTQGYRFGGVVQQALVEWRKGAEKALDELMTEVADLEAKDFAYLLRFRLQEEGEPMGHYLEWLFGESIKALVDDCVDWDHKAFRLLDDHELSKGVEGAFEGPSVRIASMFHRIRINEYKRRKQERDELGDLYVSEDGASIRAVVTPDCDLVPRKGKLKVGSLLTMGGALRSFEKESTSADHFILRGKKAYSVKWDPKDLRSFPVEGKGSLADTKELAYAGTLRPLYAQEMQRVALADLARLGLAVSPAMGIDAAVRAHIRVKSGKGTDFREIPIEHGAIATIMLGRGDGEQGHLVLLRRRYLHDLADALTKIKLEDLTETDAERLKTFLLDKKEAERARGFLAKGALTKEAGPLGTRFSIAVAPEKKADSAWLQFLLSIDDEGMEELLAADPLFTLDSHQESPMAPPQADGVDAEPKPEGA